MSKHIHQSPGSAATGIHPASVSDLGYVVHLQRSEREALGFCPKQALEEKIRMGRIWITVENDQPAGFLHHGSFAKPEVRIFQAAIQYDARRRHLGLALAADLEARVRAANPDRPCAISLRCRNDLLANDFWKSAGFALMGSEPGGRRGKLNVWAKRLTPGPIPLHSRVHRCPGCNRPTTDTWTPADPARGVPVPRRWAMCTSCVAEAMGRRDEEIQFALAKVQARARNPTPGA